MRDYDLTPCLSRGWPTGWGSDPHQPQEFLEVRVGIVGSGRGFRMILHRKDWKFFVANAFHGLIIQIDVGHFESRRAGNAAFLTRHGESVILRGDKYMPSR